LQLLVPPVRDACERLCRVTTEVVYKLRNMTHDGELTKFAELAGE
jgi:hypothetical protein